MDYSVAEGRGTDQSFFWFVNKKVSVFAGTIVSILQILSQIQ